MALAMDFAAQSGHGSTIGSTTATESIVRSRTWSEDITRNWNKPVTEAETVAGRADRYAVYFTLDSDQLKYIMNRFLEELDCGLRLHKLDADTQWTKEQCSLKMLDTCVSEVPTGCEKGVAYGLDFGGTNLRAVRIELSGSGKIAMSQNKKSLKNAAPDLRKGLLDANATATQLFDCFSDSIKGLMTENGDMSITSQPYSVGFTFSFPLHQKALKTAHLTVWTKEFESGRNTNDPVEGHDVGALLEYAFKRNKIPATATAILNDTTGTMLSCAYEKPDGYPACLIGLILGSGVNACYYQEDAADFGYKGHILNTELGGFDKGLPINDVDLEVDFAHEPSRGRQLFEKMVSGVYIGEVCRRLVVKVYQTRAPELSWLRESMPAEACSMIINDTDPELAVTKEVVERLWEWDASLEDLEIVQSLFILAFDRSAALAAAVVAAMAYKTGRLQPAMGGLTVGVDGSLYTQNRWYAARLRYHLTQVLGEEGAALIRMCKADDGSGKGAAILGAITLQ